MFIDDRIEKTISGFSRIFLGGIPPIITNDSAFLSFICILTATEALARYRYDKGSAGRRFKDFVKTYFASPYPNHVHELWDFRNRVVHAFSTGRFALTHHQSEIHFRRSSSGAVVLNAEDFYAALLSAAQRYFSEVRSSLEIQKIFIKRLEAVGGKAITIGEIGLSKEKK